MRMHAGESPFDCDECDKSFRSEEDPESHASDDSYCNFKLTLEELKKIVVDKSLVGFLQGTCRNQDDPWTFKSLISIETFCLLNNFLRRVHLVL